jgi:ubiquinone/menaquinone biosynthesis C-methylase UbiE
MLASVPDVLEPRARKVFERGRKASIAAAERIGGRILDVGIGTGISLLDYARTNRVVGVDYSEAMLRKAYERVSVHGLDHVAALAVMDAQRLIRFERLPARTSMAREAVMTGS